MLCFWDREGREGGRDAVRLSGVGMWVWMCMSGCLLNHGLLIDLCWARSALDGMSDEADACVPVRRGHKMRALPRFQQTLSASRHSSQYCRTKFHHCNLHQQAYQTYHCASTHNQATAPHSYHLRRPNLPSAINLITTPVQNPIITYIHYLSL